MISLRCVVKGVTKGQPIFLMAAMFGSALTLAYMIKMLYSVFWGERPKKLARVREVPNAPAVEGRPMKLIFDRAALPPMLTALRMPKARIAAPVVSVARRRPHPSSSIA